MKIYEDADERAAVRALRRSAWTLGVVLAACAALYIALILRGSRGGMLAVLLAAFVFAVLLGDLRLLPALRYRRFLRELRRGLRQTVSCTVLALDAAVCIKDGAPVRTLHVRLADGDERRYYVAAKCAAEFPAAGARLQLTGFGRHVTAYEADARTP